GAMQVQGSTLEVDPGQTLALLGGEVSVNGGTLEAKGGRMEVGGVAAGQVSLQADPAGFALAYDNVQNFRDIQFSQKSRVDVSSTIKIIWVGWVPTPIRLSSGSVQIQGANVSLTDGSGVASNNWGFEPGGNIEVNASESLDISGLPANGRRGSFLSTIEIGRGQAGDIRISTQKLTLQEGGSIETYGSFGRGGDINVNASESITILGPTSGNLNSITNIVSYALIKGTAGDVTISTGNLSVRDGGHVASLTFGSGNTGDVRVMADSIEVVGVTPLTLIPSSVMATTINSGDAGTVILDTGRLSVRDSGRVSSVTLASGSAGSIVVNASEWVEVRGAVSGSINPSLIDSSANLWDQVLRDRLYAPSRPTGNAGDVTINTPELRVADGAQVTVKHDGIGDAGILNVQTDNIVLRDRGGITASTVSGTGGNINLQVQEGLDARQNSLISSEANEGRGGNITIAEANHVFLDSGSQITASATGQADGGDINLQVSDRLQVNNGSSITVNSLGTGNAGNLQIQADRIELKDQGLLSAVTASGEGGNINLQVGELLLMRRGALISAEAGGTGNGGNITIDIPNGFIVAVSGENSNIIANAFQGNGGKIDITTQGIFGLEFRDRLTEFSDITASSQFGVSGTVTISNPNTNPATLSAELQGDVLDPNQQVTRGCDALGDNRFVAVGRGGLPENPSDRRSGVNAWQDVRDLSIAHPSPVTRDALSLPKSHPLPDSQPPLVEATGWRAKADGTVEIYAGVRAQPDALETGNCAAQRVSQP
ncbi:MAG: hypothetical protein AB4290_11070, partial [Spirulina sp.]